MAIVIDGYNLLNGANIVAEGPGAYTLEKSRTSLLRFLVSVLSQEERANTTVVFDGQDAPPGLPRTGAFAGMVVMFSRPGSEADDLIEQLILADSSPRRLTVVSSDHRLHRAAGRRQATAVDSDVWYQQRRALRRSRAEATPRVAPIDSAGLSEDEVAAWLDEFGPIDLADVDPNHNQPRSAKTEIPGGEQISPNESTKEEFFNPFPEGYGEDLLDE